MFLAFTTSSRIFVSAQVGSASSCAVLPTGPAAPLTVHLAAEVLLVEQDRDLAV